MTGRPEAEAPLRTAVETEAAALYARIFAESPDSIETKLQNFPKYVRRQDLTRLLARYEIFRKVLAVKGSIIECGVYRGFGLMAWAKLSAMLEPENLTRRIYSFDTFAGFPRPHEKDQSAFKTPERGELGADCYEELQQLIREYDADRFLGHLGKVELIRGDMAKTIPEFVDRHQHLLVSLLYLDCDLYEPTRVALEHFVPRMPTR